MQCRISTVPEQFFHRFPKIDIILASDCLFDPSVFEDLLATIWMLLQRNPDGQCVFSYEERSAEWTIEDLLQKSDLKCQLVEPDSFDVSCVLVEQLPQTTATVHLGIITLT